MLFLKKMKNLRKRKFPLDKPGDKAYIMRIKTLTSQRQSSVTEVSFLFLFLLEERVNRYDKHTGIFWQ